MNVIKQGSKTLGIAIGFKRTFKSLKITTKALDGTLYVQNPGRATEQRKVAAYCDTLEKREDLDTASNNGALLDITWGDKTYKGYIDDDIKWKEWVDGHGVGSFNLNVKEVVE